MFIWRICRKAIDILYHQGCFYYCFIRNGTGIVGDFFLFFLFAYSACFISAELVYVRHIDDLRLTPLSIRLNPSFLFPNKLLLSTLCSLFRTNRLIRICMSLASGFFLLFNLFRTWSYFYIWLDYS